MYIIHCELLQWIEISSYIIRCFKNLHENKLSYIQNRYNFCPWISIKHFVCWITNIIPSVLNVYLDSTEMVNI